MMNSDLIPLGSRPIDRAGHHRGDDAWQAQAFQREDALVFILKEGRVLAGPDGGLVWLGPEAGGLAAEARRLFMGLDKEGAPVFALSMPEGFDLETSLIAGTGEFTDFRMCLARMGELEANLASTARSIFEWHTSHRFCAKCGTESQMCEAGWKRICPACETQHFPRTDPVAIMLATRGDKALLGRQKIWPAGMWSCLAGFIEPGETLEQGAAREIHEEAGVVCNPAEAEYLFCQPWPFPSSLMIGMLLPAQTEEITIDPSELEAARWVTREEARAIIAGTHPEIVRPMSFAVAHHILKEWSERDD